MNHMKKMVVAICIEWHWCVIRVQRCRVCRISNHNRIKAIQKAIAIRRFRADQLGLYYEVLAGIRELKSVG